MSITTYQTCPELCGKKIYIHFLYNKKIKNKKGKKRSFLQVRKFKAVFNSRKDQGTIEGRNVTDVELGELMIEDLTQKLFKGIFSKL